MTWPSFTARRRDRGIPASATAHLDAEMLDVLALAALNEPDLHEQTLNEQLPTEQPPTEQTLTDQTLTEQPLHEHLESCPACLAVWQARVTALGAARGDVEALVDGGVSDEALEQQRASILARLAGRDGGRVLAFPAREARPARRERPALRWLAAAAAAGLLIGVGAGQQLNHVKGLNAIAMSHLFGPGHEAAPRLSARHTSWRTESPATVQLVPVHAHDELFLSEMETALTYRGVAELRALDDLTPRVVPTVARGNRRSPQ